MDNTRISRHMKGSFWVLLFLDHGKGSGNHGHHPNVASLCGWSHTISAGRLIAWHVVGYLIRSIVLFVTKKRRLSTIYLSTVYSQENFGTREFWFNLFRQVGLQSLSPQPTELSFHDWWEKASSSTTDELTRQGINSLIILGAWTIWNHRNGCVFDGAAPNLAGALIAAGEEHRLWSMAGARGLSFLTALPPVFRVNSFVVVALCSSVTSANVILKTGGV